MLGSSLCDCFWLVLIWKSLVWLSGRGLQLAILRHFEQQLWLFLKQTGPTPGLFALAGGSPCAKGALGSLFPPLIQLYYQLTPWQTPFRISCSSPCPAASTLLPGWPHRSLYTLVSASSTTCCSLLVREARGTLVILEF